LHYYVRGDSLRRYKVLICELKNFLVKILSHRQKILIKKGFTLIEVLCSITVFSVLFMTALFIQVDALKVKTYNEEMNNCTLVMEYVKNSIMYNCSYDSLLNLSMKEKTYIDCSNLKFQHIKNINVTTLFSDEKPLKEPYIILKVTGEKVLKVNLQLHAKMYGNIKVEECDFYKGNYKK